MVLDGSMFSFYGKKSTKLFIIAILCVGLLVLSVSLNSLSESSAPEEKNDNNTVETTTEQPDDNRDDIFQPAPAKPSDGEQNEGEKF